MSFAFIETLRRFLQDPALATKNTVFDASHQTYYTDRVDALTPDKTVWLTPSDVDTVTDVPTGTLAPNVQAGSIGLDIDGFEFRTSRFRDGLQSTPRKIRRRKPDDLLFTTPNDRVRYILSDPTDGVLLLDQNLEIVRTFPGLVKSGTITGSQYADCQCAVAATVAATEYMVIACGTQHAVQIVNYATGALVATVGTPGTPGLPDTVGDLTDPVSVAVDEVNSRLFIACRTGAATGGDASDTGFVCEFDITNPATPTFVSYVLKGSGLYRLNNSECTRPSDVFLQPSKVTPAQDAQLWIANGLGDTAAFTRTAITDPWVPTLVFEAQGPNYVLGPDTVTVTTASYAENALDVLTDASSVSRLYVAGSHIGKVEVFRVSPSDNVVPLGTHEFTYGERVIENSTPYGVPLRSLSTPVQPKLTFGGLSQATGVVADYTILTGDSSASEVLTIADADAGRVQRLRLDVFNDVNTVTFLPLVSAVPFSIDGWFIADGNTFPNGSLTLEVRDPGDSTVTPVIPATGWRSVPNAGFSNAASGELLTRYQFRLRATVSRTSMIERFLLNSVGVLLRQQW